MIDYRVKSKIKSRGKEKVKLYTNFIGSFNTFGVEFDCITHCNVG